MSVVVHVRSGDWSCFFSTRWPLPLHVQKNWLEVYHKAMRFAMTRNTWYCKYNPYPVRRDKPPSDDPKLWLKVADDIQRASWNILL